MKRIYKTISLFLEMRFLYPRQKIIAQGNHTFRYHDQGVIEADTI